MTTSTPIQIEAVALHGLRPRAARGYWSDAWYRFRTNWLALGAALCLVCLFLIAFSAPLISQYVTGYEPGRANVRQTYRPPSAANFFGTDEFGRDYFTRAVYGGQITLTLGLTVAAIQLLIGVPLGLIAGYFGGAADDLISGVVAFINCLPVFFLLVLLASWTPPSLWSLALIIGVFGWTGVTRQIRGVTLSTKRRDYVEVARALGATNTRIMLRHILPNLTGILLVVAGFDVAAGMVAETGLSYLGLGIRPPTPSWGNMLQNSLTYLNKAPYLIVFPGACLFLTTLAIFLSFDGLRDALDPRLRGVK